MQQTCLPNIREPAPLEDRLKGRRLLRPAPFTHRGKRLYSNELGQEFYARVRLDGRPGNYSIEIFQLEEGKPMARFSASAQLMGKALMIKFMTRTSWDSLPDRQRAPTGYCAARMVFNEAISIAQKLGAETIYLKAASHKLFAYYRSLGFKEISELKNSDYMELSVPKK